jgi:divalent metal cation (Fe/Co/Zn/Cd) transporter
VQAERLGSVSVSIWHWASSRTLWIAGANVTINEGLYRHNVGVGGQTGSAAVTANAWDHRSDALCSLAVLVGLDDRSPGGSGLPLGG